MNTVAAIPGHLRQYAIVITSETEQLRVILRALNHALERFGSRCREYSIPAVSGLSAALSNHCHTIDELAAWMRSIADQFIAADNGVLSSIGVGRSFTTLGVGQASGWVGGRYPGLWRLDIGARLVWRLIWDRRASPLPSVLAALSRRIATRLGSGWSGLVVVAPSLRWLAVSGLTIKDALSYTPRWLVTTTLTSIFSGQTILALAASRPWRDQVLNRLLSWSPAVTLSYPNLSWMVRCGPVGFGALVGLSVQSAYWYGTRALSSALVQQLVRRSLVCMLHSTGIVGSYHRYQQLLDQSIIFSRYVMMSQPAFSGQLLRWRLISLPIGSLMSLISRSHAFKTNLDPVNALALMESGLWGEGFHHLSLDQWRGIALYLEQINRDARASLFMGPLIRPTTGPDAEPDGRAEATAVFPPLECQLEPDRPYRITPAALQASAHSLISPYLGEEVRAARVGAQEYAIGISGLNLQNMAYSTNGLVSVIETASGKERIDHNAYYQTVRTRILRLLEQLPPGSSLHLTGHSMGGGMCILLSNDPAIQQALAQRNIRLASVTTLGAVRPLGEWGDTPSVINNQAVVVRHYVDSDDALADSVGAGHSDVRYRAVVYRLDNALIDQPSVAHSAYESFDYTRLPEAAQTMPFMVDPAYFELLSIAALPEEDPIEPEWTPTPPLSA
ncbi:MAG: hypothetical protein K6356_08635 [Chloroflexus sp.]